jgi:hypothetical protein
MKARLHGVTSVIFWTTLSIYILIWLTVSYIGVYVTYVAGPLLFVTGLLAYATSPKDDQKVSGSSR